jgi:hypothetical protein
LDCVAIELLRAAAPRALLSLETESEVESLFCATAAVLLGDVIVANTNEIASIEHNDREFFADTVSLPQPKGLAHQ